MQQSQVCRSKKFVGLLASLTYTVLERVTVAELRAVRIDRYDGDLMALAET